MQLRGRLRLAACLALPLAGTVVVAACNDSHPAAPPTTEDWIDDAVVSAQIQLQGVSIADGKKFNVAPISQSVDLRIRRFQSSQVNFARPQVQHFRDGAGRMMSVSTVFGPNGVPKRVYFFRGGKIQSVATPGFQRYRGGWVQTSLRMTVFDTAGKPIMRGASHLIRLSAITRAQRIERALFVAVRDATNALGDLILPSPLQAEDDDGICESERSAFLTKSSAASAASAIWAAAFWSCAKYGDVDACNRVKDLGAAVLLAAQAAYEAWEKWMACKTSNTPTPPPTDGASAAEGGKSQELMDVVDDFVRQAEAEGTYECTPSGDDCIYWIQ